MILALLFTRMFPDVAIAMPVAITFLRLGLNDTDLGLILAHLVPNLPFVAWILVGTFETTGISFQDGLFTDPVLGPQRLAKRTSAHVGGGLRLFFCDTFDMGVGWQHAITGKYLANDFGRFEVRYRY